MIKFQPISTSDVQHYRFMEELLTDTFPAEEYRELADLREYTDRTGNFHNNIIFEDNMPIGFITYWDFDRFCYVEHFAINPALRNGGYGKKALEHLRKVVQLPIVLEVERPDEEMAQRRISFYQRQGFTLWEQNYRQPPYKKGDSFLPMYLMVYGNLDSDRDYKAIRKQIYLEVYGMKIYEEIGKGHKKGI